ncbi:Cysteine-rich secretory protein family protein [Paraliobacillus sp. PM-2]|uniref:CAP domain-containing protein n=1 Tax=Paraliobacillus sp. PM-2 TaxID=1462524 RepID=UPI00061BA69B|nr:CAP domain-containing protein [Paraliobacillus sp. PM-2]CQR47815.1 Cysteine-rich secretory protein family protein [Paraliobacillus sp. PM-2]
MKKISMICLFFVVIIGITYFFENVDRTERLAFNLSHRATSKQMELSTKISPKYVDKNEQRNSISKWMDRSSESLTDVYGEPNQVASTPYGYDWWIYTDKHAFIQFGIKNNRIVTVYGTGIKAKFDPFLIGTTYQEMDKRYTFTENVSFQAYHFNLTKKDVQQRPLVRLSEDVFAQLYFDAFQGKLSSFRLVTKEILLTHQPYHLNYWGKLPKKERLSEGQWKQIALGVERQIFYITNIIRQRFGKPELSWNEQVKQVALSHSKDMANNQYFSHYSPSGGGLEDRLNHGKIAYELAGENIAAQYVDGPAVLAGWLNSKSHRRALLNENYTELGVGVYHKHYTQNFLKP